MSTPDLVLYIAAMILFGLAAFRAGPKRIDAVPLGLLLWLLATMPWF
jgi:hypothetical protein